MPRARTTCARRPLHLGECRTAKALADTRARKTARRVGKTLFTPEAKARWNRRYNLKRYDELARVYLGKAKTPLPRRSEGLRVVAS